MAEPETVRTFTVSRAQGTGVVVTVCEAELDDGDYVRVGTRVEVAKRAARSWDELAALGAEYGVPEAFWDVDEEAEELLGPEPEQAPKGDD